MSYRKNFVGIQKRIRISHGKRAIGVRAIEVRLYLCRFFLNLSYTDFWFSFSLLFLVYFLYVGDCFRRNGADLTVYKSMHKAPSHQYHCRPFQGDISVLQFFSLCLLFQLFQFSTIPLITYVISVSHNITDYNCYFRFPQYHWLQSYALNWEGCGPWLLHFLCTCISTFNIQAEIEMWLSWKFSVRINSLYKTMKVEARDMKHVSSKDTWTVPTEQTEGNHN